MTGRGMGYCVLKIPDGTETLRLGPMRDHAVGYPIHGYTNPVPGRGFWTRSFFGAYGLLPYAQGIMRYGYGARYAPAWSRAFGWFGRGFGRGWVRGFGRRRGRGRW